MTGPDHYYLLTYDVPQRLVTIREDFATPEEAIAAYDATERLHRRDDDIEVVLVGADSIETVKRTHSHYFARTEDELFSAFTQFLERIAK